MSGLPANRSDAPHTRGRILIVDDDLGVCGGLRRAFEAFGYAVHIAMSRADAVAEVKRVKFDVILMDWALPDGEGPDVIRTLRGVGVSCPEITITGVPGWESRM